MDEDKFDQDNKAVEDREAEKFLLLAQLVHDGYYNLRISWGQVKRLFGKILESDPERSCAILRENGYTYGCEDGDPFMLLKEPDIKLGNGETSELFLKFFDVLDSNPLSLNVAMLVFAQRSLIMGILSSFYDHEIEFSGKSENRILIPMVTSEKFLEFDKAGELLEKRVRQAKENDIDISGYLEQPWFLELMLIIKNGYYGNGNFNYIDSLESSFRSEFIDGILDLIKSGILITIILNFKKLLRNEETNYKIRNFVRKSREEAKLKRFYDWLSIANDLAVGTEFLIGSFEFLPSGNELFGVFLFIVGSSQLLIRPIIQIFRKAHLSRLYRRKIRF